MLKTRVRQVEILGGQTVSGRVYQFRQTEAKEEGPDGAGLSCIVESGVPGPGVAVDFILLLCRGSLVEG